MILAFQSLAGKLPPWELRKLYWALVDPHCLNVDPPLLELLENIRHNFLQKILGVGEKCPTPLLFTETAIKPVRYRRIIYAMNDLKYLLQLPDYMLRKREITESISLAINGKPCGAMDLHFVLSELPFQTVPLYLRNISLKMIDDIVKSIERGIKAQLQQYIGSSPRTYLLAGRMQPENDGKLVQKTLYFRKLQAQEALVYLILSGHSLAVKRLRWCRP